MTFRNVGLLLLSLFLPSVLFASHPGVNGKIVFVSGRDGLLQIYSMNPDGSEQTNISNTGAPVIAPRFSADGSRIVFSRGLGAASEIYVMNADGSGQTRLTNNTAADVGSAWSPDGSQIVFSSNRDGNSEIYVMDATGANLQRLTFDGASDFDPDWSPDGAQIAFTSNRSGGNDIFVMDVDGSNVANLTQNAASDFGASWSPDGSQIAFVSERDANFEIYVMNADGTAQLRLTNNLSSDIGPAWSPDGRRIAFTSFPGASTQAISVMDFDGSNPTNVSGATSAPGDFDPTWQPLGPRNALRNLIDDVRDLVTGGSLTPLQGLALNLPLRFAIVALDLGNTQLAIDLIQFFVNRVEGFVSFGILAASEGQPLVDQANAILSFLQG